MLVTHFPSLMYDVLDEAETKGHAHIISWCSGGRSFRIHEPDQMVNILNAYFSLTKYKSFLRQLQAYGFTRITRGELKGTCSHPLLIRGKRFITIGMKRKTHRRKSNKASGFPLPPLKVSEINLQSMTGVSSVSSQGLGKQTPKGSIPIVPVEDQENKNFDWSLLGCGRYFDQCHNSLGKSNLVTISDPPKNYHMTIPFPANSDVPQDYSSVSDAVSGILDDIDDDICNYFTQNTDAESNNDFCPLVTNLDVREDDDDWIREMLYEGDDNDFDRVIFATTRLPYLTN